jgi:peroxin-3
VGPSEIGTSAPPSVADTNDDDGKSSSIQTDGYIHASQVAVEGESTTGAAEPSTGAEVAEEKKSKKSKAQLWNEMKISCKYAPMRRMIWH